MGGECLAKESPLKNASMQVFGLTWPECLGREFRELWRKEETCWPVGLNVKVFLEKAPFFLETSSVSDYVTFVRNSL